MYVNPLFRDRVEAGQVLAQRLKGVIHDSNPIVLALPRGGVLVGFEVAKALHSDLDILLVRKLGVPGHEELAIGAIASGSVRVLNQALIGQLGVLSTALPGRSGERSSGVSGLIARKGPLWQLAAARSSWSVSPRELRCSPPRGLANKASDENHYGSAGRIPRSL
jgi:hypothetical protein